MSLDQILMVPGFSSGGPRLVISDVSESFDFEANRHLFFVNSNLTWSWSADVAWITSDEDTPQTGSQTFSYSVTENISTQRTGTITFTAGDLSATHTVTQGPYPILTIDDENNTFTYQEGTLSFNVTSNTDWTWYSNQEWVVSGEAVFQSGNQEFTYSVTANTGAERTATITFVDVQAGVVVAQHSITQQTEPLISLSQETFEVESGETTNSVNVTSNTDWTWSSDSAWVTSVESSPQNGNQEFTFTVAANATGVERVGTITFTAGDKTASITITQEATIPLLLDSYTGAIGLSLRKIRTAYTGDCIRVVRESDDAEQDIGFIGNDLDTTAIETFCSGTTGYVTTWYDQVGGRNAVQATRSRQPIIYESGSVVVNEHGLPAMRLFDNDPSNPGDGLRVGTGWVIADSTWIAQSMVYSLLEYGDTSSIVYSNQGRSVHAGGTGQPRFQVIKPSGSWFMTLGQVIPLNTTTIRLDGYNRTIGFIYLGLTETPTGTIADIDADAAVSFSDIGNPASVTLLQNTLISEIVGFTVDESANNLAIRTDQFNYWTNVTPPPADTLSIDDETQSFDAAGGSHSFNVTSNTTWSWESNSAWLTSAEGASQTGNQEFSYTVTENESTERTGVITFTAGDLTVTHMVTQAAPIAPPSPILVLNDAEESFTSEPGSHTISVTANGDWSWEADAAWVTSGEAVTQNGNQDFTYSVTENLTGTERTAHITFTSGLLTASHMIVQSATIAPPPEMEDFTEFDYVADMLASTDPAKGTGEIWYAQGYRYVELDPAATNQHLTTAAGVKLRALQDGSGAVTTEQLGWLPDVVQQAAAESQISKLDSNSMFVFSDFYNCDNMAVVFPQTISISGAYRRHSGFFTTQQTGTGHRIRVNAGGGSLRRIKVECEQIDGGPPAARILSDRYIVDDIQMEHKSNSGILIEGSNKTFVNNCEFWDAHWNLYYTGGLRNRVTDNYHTADWETRNFGEGIKSGGLTRTDGFKVVDCHFDRLRRDGLDTTGGGIGIRVSNSIFHLCGIGRDPTHLGVPQQGIDLKVVSHGSNVAPGERPATQFFIASDNIFWGAGILTTQTGLDIESAETRWTYGFIGLGFSRNVFEPKQYFSAARGGSVPMEEFSHSTSQRMINSVPSIGGGAARNALFYTNPNANGYVRIQPKRVIWLDCANYTIAPAGGGINVDWVADIQGPKITGRFTNMGGNYAILSRLNKLDDYIQLRVSISLFSNGPLLNVWSDGGVPAPTPARGFWAANCFGKDFTSILSYGTGNNGLINDCIVSGNIVKAEKLVADTQFLGVPTRTGLYVIQNTSDGAEARTGTANIDPVIEQNVGVT